MLCLYRHVILCVCVVIKQCCVYTKMLYCVYCHKTMLFLCIHVLLCTVVFLCTVSIVKVFCHIRQKCDRKNDKNNAIVMILR